jgi:hypothetical protein
MRSYGPGFERCDGMGALAFISDYGAKGGESTIKRWSGCIMETETEEAGSDPLASHSRGLASLGAAMR